MKPGTQLLLWLYIRLLNLYPQQYQVEYGQELQTVFSLAVAESARQGTRAIVKLGLRELRDLPGALIREHRRERRKRKMKTSPEISPVDAQSSWGETFVGLWLFLIFGPVPVVMAYLTLPTWLRSGSGLGSVLLVIGFVLLPLLMSLGIGWAKGWPRWSYPYLGLLFAAVLISTANKVSAASNQWGLWVEGLLTVIVFLLIVSVFVLLTRAFPPLRPLYHSIRHDWTRLSFALYTFSLIFGQVDHDEDPTFSLNVFLPTVILLLGALAYMRSTTKAQRFLALLGGVTLAVGLRMAGGKILFVYFWVWLAILVVAPALLALIPRSDKSLRTG